MYVNNNIVSICAIRSNGSLRVPKMKSDRALLIKASRGRTILCGSNIAKYLPASRDKVVVTRDSIKGDELYSHAVIRTTTETLERNDVAVWGGHRIYAAVATLRPIYVVVYVPDDIPNDDMGDENKNTIDEDTLNSFYGYVEIPPYYTLAKTEKLEPYILGEKSWDLYAYYLVPDEYTHVESQHINIIRDVLEMPERQTRNSLVRSSFIYTMKFDLHGKKNPSDGSVSFEMPVSTTSGTWLKGLMAEFVMFINGRTDSKELENLGVNIWKANTESTDGAIGPCYGHNYRNYGGSYDKNNLYNDGVDQLMDIIKTLKKDPMSRRMVLINWNPSQNNQCPLPPCQLYFQFYLDNDGRLSLFAMNRSSDICCAGMWNTAFASMLLGLVSMMTEIPAGMLHIQFNDTHIYESQYELARTHIERIPFARFPLVTMSSWPTKMEDIKVNTRDAWAYHPNISYPMVA